MRFIPRGDLGIAHQLDNLEAVTEFVLSFAALGLFNDVISGISVFRLVEVDYQATIEKTAFDRIRGN